MTNEEKVLIGRRLKVARIEAGLTAEEMAKAVFRTTSAIHHYERGRNVPPGDVLAAWARTCNRSVAWLMGTESVMPPTLEGVSHFGVELLARDRQLMERHRVTPAEIEQLRGTVLLDRRGHHIVVETITSALDLLHFLRNS